MPIVRRSTKEKILLCLNAGFELSVTHSANKQRYILRTLPIELKRIDRRYITRSLRALEKEGLVQRRSTTQDGMRIELSAYAKQQLGALELRRLSTVRPTKWDQKWRLLIYDVPEDRKRGRDAIRYELRNMGFVELQHSVWIFPFDVTDILLLIRELYDLKSELIVLTADRFDGDHIYQKHFDIS
ncbi:MAG: hypothetical protein AAB343_03160 [Patescibacteria group bacterium]